MKRTTKLLALCGVLLALCIAFVAVLGIEQKQEDIRAEEAVILSLSAEDIQSIAWDTDGEGLAFHRDGEGWVYDDDAAFSVSTDAMEKLLANFDALSSAFVIENVENYGDYGLDDPQTTITLTTAAATHTLHLGDFSAMDQQRYLDMGDGKVYLMQEDPLDYVDLTLGDLLAHDDSPTFPTVQSITLSGAENYTILCDPENGSTVTDDMYFAQRSGKLQVLNDEYVTDLLNALTLLELSDYVTYSASVNDLAACGLDDPALTLTVSYLDREDAQQTFTVHIGLDAEDVAAAAKDEEVEIAKYVRVGDSSIIYTLDAADYEVLEACGYDDLRYKEVLLADFAVVTAVDVTLEGEKHRFTADGEDDERVWLLDGEEVDFAGAEAALTALTADSFTDDDPTGKEEISLTVYLDNEDFPQIEIALYRHDGQLCLAQVDGESVSLVSRSDVMELVEAIQMLVL